MTATNPHGFELWEEGDTQPQTKYNDLATKVNLWLGRRVLSRTTDAQPGSPAANDAYIITGSASGAAWGSFTEDYVAVYQDGAWVEYAPVGAVSVFIVDESAEASWDGSSWVVTSITNAVQDSDFPTPGIMVASDGSGSYAVIKCNFSATTQPTVNDDAGDGYAVGSQWLDTTNDKGYICLDSTVAAAVWKAITPTAGTGFTPVYKAANYTANASEIVMVDSSLGTYTITLPATPSDGDYVVIADCGNNASTNNITIARNGSTIRGAATNIALDRSGGRVELIYDGSGGTWEYQGAKEIVASVAAKGDLEQFRSRTVSATINDDAVYSYDFGANVSTSHVIYSDNGGTRRGLFVARTIATSHVNSIASTGISTTTGALTGTTGTDGNLTISAHTDNKLYVENRTGGAVFAVITISRAQFP